MKRRMFITGALALGLSGRRAAAWDTAPASLSDIERTLDARIGVFARNCSTGKCFQHRAEERFAMCSTFKASLAALCLRQAERGLMDLDQRLKFGPSDVLPTSFVTGKYSGSKGLPIRTLCEAAVEHSDNTAANLLLARVGGPSAVTRFFREIGDETTRLDRIEMALNANEPGDPRDTTTPQAMAESLARLTLSASVLERGSRDQLIGWMRNEQNAKDRIRAAVPRDWIVANKPGTTPNGAANDIATLWAPDGTPFVVTVYIDTRMNDVQPAIQAVHSVAQMALGEVL
ncbi:MAG: class A beta-lactamase [Tsuneonella suprasediminis]